jgi:hypothetical protein
VNWVWIPSQDCSSATALSVEAVEAAVEAAVDGGVTGAATCAGAGVGVAGAAAVLPFPDVFGEVVFPLPEPFPELLALAVDLVAEAFGLEARDFFAGEAGAEAVEAVDLVDDDFLAGIFFDNYT